MSQSSNVPASAISAKLKRKFNLDSEDEFSIPVSKKYLNAIGNGSKLAAPITSLHDLALAPEVGGRQHTTFRQRRAAERALVSKKLGISMDEIPIEPQNTQSSKNYILSSDKFVEPTPFSDQVVSKSHTLLEQALQHSSGPKTQEEKDAALEADIMNQLKQTNKSSLMSAKEKAQGIRYTEPTKTDWIPPSYARAWSKDKCMELRKKWHIIVGGDDVPPPLNSFESMKFPKAIVEALRAKGIERPTPIQVQGLPAALSGRDMIGIAFTGSGKTMVFCLPLVMFALQEEMRQPFIRNEGPVGIILAPSRELAIQHADNLKHFASYLVKHGYPELRTMVAIGGENLRTQMEPMNRGAHMVVATPGRLLDHLRKKRFNLSLCRYVCLDEGDRMLDMGFDEDIKEIFSFFEKQRQTLIFSATMPKKIQDFAEEALVQPVVVNVGRAGAANLDVIQEVEYVKQEMRILYLLNCLQKTAPPVLIFAENKRDVDDIQEYLLLKGVAAVSVHGDKSQEERNESIRAFRDSKADVLVATDVAAKGLDFPDIQHVINFDVPKDIETYVHRIGRTGRCGKTGVATTFINQSVDERLLLDLKHLLREAKQRIPPVLMALEDPFEYDEATAVSHERCPYCGGQGHRVADCPKLEREKRKTGPTRDYLGGGSEW